MAGSHQVLTETLDLAKPKHWLRLFDFQQRVQDPKAVRWTKNLAPIARNSASVQTWLGFKWKQALPNGCGSKLMVPFWLVGAPPISVYVVGIGMFTEGTGF